MYRLYNRWSGEHLFTADSEEYDYLASIGWNKEGVAWQSPATGDVVYRLYNPYSGDHFYTKDAAEYAHLGSIGWNQEGEAFRSGGGTPIYRLFNRWLTAGTHLFTTDKDEYDDLVVRGWSGENVAFYGESAEGTKDSGSTTGTVTAKSSVNDYSWAELSAISKRIAAAGSDAEGIAIAKSYGLVDSEGKLDGTQVKTFKLTNGLEREAEIIGFRHDERADGSGKAGISWLCRTVVANHVYNLEDSIAGGWAASSVRKYVNDDVFDILPSDLRGVVVPVRKLTNNADDPTKATGVTATTDSLWLLSSHETYGDIANTSSKVDPVQNQEGAQYQLFRNLGVNESSSSRLRPVVANDWDWLRTPLYCIGPSFRSFELLYMNGRGDATSRRAVMPGFCI